MNDHEKSIRVTALYQFTRFDDCEAIQRRLKPLCDAAGIRGTLILAPEGINGTIAGSGPAIEQVLTEIRSLPGCANLSVKDSFAETSPFHRMKVRIKREIVTMGEPDIDPLQNAGEYLGPEEWNAVISDPDTILIDTRNDYEVGIGTFRNAINPNTKSFRDFPAWFREWRAARSNEAPPPKIAMFCTGGIRCEKATAFLKSEGLDEVYHLSGGILKYLEDVPAAESLWDGECFVFDERVSVKHGLEPGSYDLCRACRRPIDAGDKASALFEEGVSCPSCHQERDERRRQGYAERHRQTLLAEARGERHVGAVYAKAKG